MAPAGERSPDNGGKHAPSARGPRGQKTQAEAQEACPFGKGPSSKNSPKQASPEGSKASYVGVGSPSPALFQYMSVRDHDVNCVRDHDFDHNVVCHRRMLEIGMNDETRMKQLDDMQASADFIEAVLMSLTSDLESIREDRKDNGSQQPSTTYSTTPTQHPPTLRLPLQSS